MKFNFWLCLYDALELISTLEMQNPAQLDGDSATEKLEKEALGSVCSVYFAANFSYIVINTSAYFCSKLQKLMSSWILCMLCPYIAFNSSEN